MKDAVIVFEHDDEINPDQSFDGISLEKVFIHYRLREEAEYAHDAKYVGINWERTEHRFILSENGHSYDRETVEVSMFKPEDWDFLKNDWDSHNGFKDHSQAQAKAIHELLRNERIIRFTEVFWFNVDNIL